ncbi:UNVERIFIED_CONTAM: hypothetical protein GTU68_067151 [Idotea baltica]|nr:hypothetical protein [Idotea baltica]
MLTRPDLLCTDAFVGGKWVQAKSGKTFDVTNPARGDVIAKVADLSRAEIADAIDAAEAARYAWAARTGKDRAGVLRKWFDLMMANQEDLAIIMTAEQGKPMTESRGEVAYGASFVEWFAEEAKRIYGETIPGHQPNLRLTVIKQPIGVAAGITPWNFPNAMIARKVAPALAAGCSFVIRPATLTPLSALAMGKLAEEAGVPAGLFSVVTSTSSSEAGKEFCENHLVRKLTFTGSTEVGRILLKQAADQALSKGGQILTGGNPHDLGGLFFQPTIVTGATKDMLVSTDETFGPFAPLFKFEDEDDVIAQANDTIFGLASYFYAKDISRVTKVAEALEYGIVGVNTGIISTEVAPFGGVKQSGLGREGSRHGIEDYMEMKYICTSV